jgi:hypothetical protein
VERCRSENQRLSDERERKAKEARITTRAASAIRAAATAEELRAGADDEERAGDHTGAFLDRRIAGREEERAVQLATVPGELLAGIGGEVAAKIPNPLDGLAQCFTNTLDNPSSTGAAASFARMEQALQFGDATLAQALDASETLGASNSLEKMMAHQLAVLHHVTMKLTHDGLDHLRKGKAAPYIDQMQANNAEGCRLLGAAFRSSAAYQGGLATLARIRQGGKQSVTVTHQHVQVNDGGQAVVAGSVGAGGGGSTPGEGDGK